MCSHMWQGLVIKDARCPQGHFHLSHNYMRSISVANNCAFVQTGVIGDCNRDGYRHSRVIKGAISSQLLGRGQCHCARCFTGSDATSQVMLDDLLLLMYRGILPIECMRTVREALCHLVTVTVHVQAPRRAIGCTHLTTTLGSCVWTYSSHGFLRYRRGPSFPRRTSSVTPRYLTP